MSPQSPLKNKEYYLFEGLPQAELTCVFSSRSAGNMSLVYGDTHDALANRKVFLNNFSIDYSSLVSAKQVHGSNISYARAGYIGKGALSYADAIIDTDALITDIKNLPLAIFTADCLSLFLYDPKRPAVGLIHAGWQGTRGNIAAKTLKLMQKEFNTDAKDVSVGFGPAIRACCYAVKEEFRKFFPEDLTQRDGHYYFDLASVNKKQLLSLGVKEKNIFDAKICTSCQNADFFSCRKEGSSCGRMISVMMLK
jgi:hypothetical protein